MPSRQCITGETQGVGTIEACGRREHRGARRRTVCPPNSDFSHRPRSVVARSWAQRSTRSPAAAVAANPRRTWRYSAPLRQASYKRSCRLLRTVEAGVVELLLNRADRVIVTHVGRDLHGRGEMLF